MVQYRFKSVAARVGGAAAVILVAAAILIAQNRATSASEPREASRIIPRQRLYKRLVEQKSAAIAVVKYVEKTEYSDGDSEESEEETSGVVIDAAGTVLCANSSMGGLFFEDDDVRTRATKIQVLYGDDDEGVEASIVARDRELDLAWIMPKKKLAQAPAYLDLTKSVAVVPGDNVLVVEKLGKFYDRAAYPLEGVVLAELSKPRSLYLVDINGDCGLPAYNEDAELIGIFVVQKPDREDREAGRSAMYGSFGVFVLPATTVASATKRAMEVARE